MTFAYALRFVIGKYVEVPVVRERNTSKTLSPTTPSDPRHLIVSILIGLPDTPGKHSNSVVLSLDLVKCPIIGTVVHK